MIENRFKSLEVWGNLRKLNTYKCAVLDIFICIKIQLSDWFDLQCESAWCGWSHTLSPRRLSFFIYYLSQF